MSWFEREAAQKKAEKAEAEEVGYKKDVKLIDLILRHANPPADAVEARNALQRLVSRIKRGDQRYLQIEERAQLESAAVKEGRYLEAETRKQCRLQLENEVRESERPDAPHHYVAKRLRDPVTGDECFDFGVCSICGKPLMECALWEACELLSANVRSRADYETLQRWWHILDRAKGFPK